MGRQKKQQKAMLHPLTWTQFFLATGISLLLYYLFITLRYYRQELKALLEKVKNQLLPQEYLSSTMPEAAQTDLATESPLGAVSTREAPILSDASQIQVAPGRDEEEIGEEADRIITYSEGKTSTTELPTFPMGTIADLLQEIKSLLELAEETKMDRTEFISLLQLIASKYSPSATTRINYNSSSWRKARTSYPSN